MELRFDPNRLWGALCGAKAELDAVEGHLDAWVHLTTAEVQKVWIRRSPEEMLVLGGILALLLREGHLGKAEAQARQELGMNSSQVSKITRKLEGALLRDYQARCVADALLAPFGRGVLNVVMGGGKTRIAAGLASVGAALGEPRWLYLVQNRELASQARRSFRELLPQMAGVLQVQEPVLEATTYSQVRRLESLQWDGVIVDEAHCLPAKTRCLPFAEVKANRRIGMSGTPLDRQDGRNALVIGLLGPVVAEVEIADLEPNGYLAKGEVKVVKFDARRGIVTHPKSGP
jgi:superfamily II DNA or RNA helicase